MGRNRWTSSEQEDWLATQVPDYWTSQQNKTVKDFFAAVETGFYRKWPFVPEGEKGPGATLKGHKKRLRQWFANNAKKGGANRGRCKILRLRGLPRIKAAYQVYSDLYYKDKLKAMVDESYAEHEEAAREEGTKPEKKIAFRNRLVMQAFEDETDQVKEEVEKARERQDGISITPPISDSEGLSEAEVLRLALNLGYQQ
ncbi:hypothetical protein BD410DRAFT_734978 [Rickenella mellea]|uniref:Uncharacterized protein n=1 Tax=Rickenella mellea TaxID=50990 RepID=A0A4Y7PFT8_9AGAM|nr:hypothetical protein BD410DRAFT_734978 [Rickenella mellea]